MTLSISMRGSATLILAAAVITISAISSSVKAQTNEANAAIVPPSNSTLGGRTLKKSVFQTNSTGVNANCGTSGCQAVNPLFPTATVLCSGAIGQTCTFHILVESSNQISSFDQGLYRFQVDGHTPTPGPTDSSGFYKFVESDPNSDATHSGSFAVMARVTNASADQTYKVSVSFGCKDDSGDGCFAFAALSSLRIDIFQP